MVIYKVENMTITGLEMVTLFDTIGSPMGGAY